MTEKTTNKYDTEFSCVLKEVFNLARGSKTNDYGETWTRLGLAGLYVKIFIKEGRLHELIWKRKSNEVKNESIRDTLLDLAAYAIYSIIALDEGNIDGEEQRKKHIAGFCQELSKEEWEDIINNWGKYFG